MNFFFAMTSSKPFIPPFARPDMLGMLGAPSVRDFCIKVYSKKIELSIAFSMASDYAFALFTHIISHVFFTNPTTKKIRGIIFLWTPLALTNQQPRLQSLSPSLLALVFSNQKYPKNVKHTRPPRTCFLLCLRSTCMSSTEEVPTFLQELHKCAEQSKWETSKKQ